MQGLSVRLWDTTWKLAGAVNVDAAGQFRFEGVAPGAYTVSLEVPVGYVAERTESRLNVAAKGDVQVKFNVRSAPVLTGRVVDGLAPAPGVVGGLLGAPGTFVAQDTPSPPGDYAFQNLAPGQYTVRVHQ